MTTLRVGMAFSPIAHWQIMPFYLRQDGIANQIPGGTYRVDIAAIVGFFYNRPSSGKWH
jgi:hypothetical protein